jgi:hypothetical protein
MHSEITAGAEQVSQDTLEAISKLTLSGSSREAISLALDLDVQTVIQVITREISGAKISNRMEPVLKNLITGIVTQN